MLKNKRKIKVQELLSYISDSEIEKIEDELNVNYQVKKITWKNMFKLLLAWILESWEPSLRVLEWIYNSPEFSNFADKWSHQTRHTTLSDRLINLDYKFFERIFYNLVNKFSEFKIERIWSTNLNLKKFDSTLVWLSQKLLKFWIKAWSPNEHHIKFTVWLEWLIPTKVNFYKEANASSEDIALWWTILEESYSKDSVTVFDRWVQNRDTYVSLTCNDVLFITRLKDKARYSIVEDKNIEPYKIWDLTIEKDMIINLYWKKSKLLDTKFRLIIWDNQDKKVLFLTNILEEYDAWIITELYKKRREIEVFFRFIKQEFWFSHFISRSENWIKSILYMTLILAILIIVYKNINKIEWYKIARMRFLTELKELILIEITKATWWSVSKLKRLYLTYYN